MARVHGVCALFNLEPTISAMTHLARAREDVRRTVLLRCHVEDTSVEGVMLLTDLGPSGCFISTNAPLALGPRIALRVMMPSTEVRLTGRVVRVESGRRFAVAIDAAALSEQSRQALEGLLQPASA